MRFVRDLFLRLLGVLLVPLATGWYALGGFFRGDAGRGAPSWILPASALAVIAAAGAVATWLGAPIERALGEPVPLREDLRVRTAGAALRLPSRASALVLAIAAAWTVALAAIAASHGISPGLVGAGVATGVGLAVMSAMLTYSVAGGASARALLALGSVDVDPRGSVRTKIIAAFCGLFAIVTLLSGSLSYARYSRELEGRLVASARTAQERAATWVSAGRVADAAELVHVATGAPTAILDIERRVVASAGLRPGGAAVAVGDVQPVTATSRVTGGWRVQRAAGPYTLVSWVAESGLRPEREAFGFHAAILSLLLLLGCALVVWSVARTLAVPLDLLGSAARRVAAGDLTASPPTVSRDDLGRLAADFRAMARGLTGLLGEVREESRAVEDGTRAIAVIGDRVRTSARSEHQRVLAAEGAVEAMQGSVQLVGRGVDSVSEYVHSTSAAFGEMAVALEDIRRQASALDAQMGTAEHDLGRLSEGGRRAKAQLAALSSLAASAQGTLSSVSASLTGLETSAIASQLAAAQAAEMADTADTVVHDTVSGIESLRAAVDDAKKRVTSLGRRSDDIDKILDFIGEVAGRTNLLSLNASIIAQQAGEHGKAFAVVADQIRELAAQISSSTKSIGQIINAVRDDVGGTARLIERGDALAAEGVAHARKSLGALQEIRTATARGHETAAAIREAVQTHGGSTRQVSDLVASVASGSRSLSEALETMGASVGAVGTIAQGIRALAENVSRALEEQSSFSRRQADSLDQIDAMLTKITRAVEDHDAATRRVRDGLQQLSQTAEQHETAVVELSGVAARLGGRCRALADRVAKFKI